MNNYCPIFFYRYEDRRYEDGVYLSELTYIFDKETKCGYWIENINGFFGINSKRRFVKKMKKVDKKRFAYPSKLDALSGFLARKKRQIAILKYKLDDVYQAIDLAELKLNELKGNNNE